MKRPFVLLALFAASLLAFGGSHRAVAQDDTPAPYPSADPHTYDDPAMHFEAPKDYYLIARRVIAAADLGDSQVVAAWVKSPNTQDQRMLAISVEQYEGNVDQYETNVENEVRTKIDDALVANKKRTQTPNGMPAYFLSITSGSGFDGKKIYELIWSDGTRGVTIAISGRLGSLEEAEARAAVSNVSAVRYPNARL